MRVRDYLPEMSDLLAVASADQTVVGRSLEQAVEKKLGEVLVDLRANPKIGSERVEHDVRYKFGFMDGAEWILTLVKEARAEAAKSRRQ